MKRYKIIANITKNNQISYEFQILEKRKNQFLQKILGDQLIFVKLFNKLDDAIFELKEYQNGQTS